MSGDSCPADNELGDGFWLFCCLSSGHPGAHLDTNYDLYWEAA